MPELQSAFSPLFRMAVKSGSVAAVLSHIRRGASVNAAGDRGRTPLMLAAAAGRFDICELLLEEGADAAARDADGQSVEAIAKAANQAAIAELLARYLDGWDQQAPRREAVVPPPPPPSTPSSVQTATHSVGQELAPLQLEESLDEGGWDAEPEARLPPEHDQIRFDRALAVHSAISARISRNHDADWSEVAAELPSTQIAALGGNEVTMIPQIRGLLLQAAVCGVVTASQITDAAAGFTDSSHDPSAFLEAVLEDLGCEIHEGLTADSWPIGRILPGEGSGTSRELARGAEQFLGALAATDPDVLSVYEDNCLRWKPLSKEERAGLWKLYRQGRRDLAFALSQAPHILDELVARLDWISTAAVLEDEPEEDAAGDPAREEAADPDLAGRSLDTLDPMLARELGLAVMRARGEENAEVGLADQLLDLELPLHLIDRVRRALLLDPASASACADLGRAMRKIERARTLMVESHQRFVLWLARRYQNRGLDLMDLVQEGNIGLIKAVEKFDPNRGAAFTTYATWWVRQAITRAIADLGAPIRIPVHRQETISKLGRTSRAFLAEYGREASIKELATSLNLSETQVEMLQGLHFEFEPIDAALADAPPRSLHDVWADAGETPEGVVIAASLRRTILAALGDLPDRERWVVELRFGIGGHPGQTLEEIGDQAGVTRERIRQIEATALRRLRMPSRSRELRPFIESERW